MNHYLKNFAKQFLLNLNISISKVTNKQQLLGFIDMVRPIQTNHDLIRIGSSHDGGYLIPNDITDLKNCFSPGVSNMADFEIALTERGIKCFLADYSVESPPIRNPLFDFQKKYLGTVDDEIFITLDLWISDKAPNDNNLLLQMDIEGAEYEVILDAKQETLSKFRILVIEFHGLDNILNSMRFDIINQTFSKLLKDFEVVHIHPNNYCKPIRGRGLIIPPAMEFTLLRKDRISKKGQYLHFPHDLDRPNDAKNLDLALPRCWQ
jgi:hypothetical protein